MCSLALSSSLRHFRTLKVKWVPIPTAPGRGWGWGVSRLASGQYGASALSLTGLNPTLIADGRSN